MRWTNRLKKKGPRKEIIVDDLCEGQRHFDNSSKRWRKRRWKKWVNSLDRIHDFSLKNYTFVIKGDGRHEENIKLTICSIENDDRDENKWRSMKKQEKERRKKKHILLSFAWERIWVDVLALLRVIASHCCDWSQLFLRCYNLSFNDHFIHCSTKTIFDRIVKISPKWIKMLKKKKI